MLIPDAVSGSVPNLAALIQQVGEAARQSDRDAVLTACRQLVEHARTTGQVPDPAATRELLKLLRGNRHFEALSVLADALIRMGRDELIVSRQYAQGLIDQGLLIAAREVLRGLIRSATDDPTEHLEAQGLMGRAINKSMSMPMVGRAIRRGPPCARRSHVTARFMTRIRTSIYGTA